MTENEKVLNIIVTKGGNCSGKSTWSKAFVLNHPDWVRVNRDDIRTQLFTDPWKHINAEGAEAREGLVTSIRDSMIKAALKAGNNVVVDECNSHSRTTKAMIKLAETLNISCIITEKPFYVDLETALERDANRTPSVGPEIVKRFFEKMGGTSFRQATPRTFTVHKSRPVKKTIEYVLGLPDAIVCDLDGTLALFGNRNPYDRDFENDEPNIPVVEVIKRFYPSHEIIFCSGRQEKARAQTQEFISRVFGDKFKYTLLMRKTGDFRKDAIIKKEIYDNHILGRYNILFILDDRQSVCKMWRSLGETVFQVAEGDF